MLHNHLTWIWYAIAVLMLVDAVGYTFGAIGPIRRALNPAEPYWQKRLLLNLMLVNHGLYLGAAIPLVGAAMTVLFTPRDTGDAIPRALAAMLIVVGLVVA